MASPGQDLDKFKRRLIRSVARLIQEKTPPNKMWDNMKTTTGCDCEVLWNRMRALTVKKLSRLLPAQDYLDRVARVARMTVTDWLMFDLVLVHEPIDVIGEDSAEDFQTLHELVQLVIKYKIEQHKTSESLANAWMSLTINFNQRGRQCSPMMLQRRWYQLKAATRKSFYDMWFKHSSNISNIVEKPKKVYIEVAKQFPRIITTHFMEWETLLENKLIVVYSEFESLIKSSQVQGVTAENNADPDLIILEPKVVTIDLGQDSDSEEPKLSSEDGTDLSDAAQSIDNDKPTSENDLDEAECAEDSLITIQNDVTSNNDSDCNSEDISDVEDFTETVSDDIMLEAQHIEKESNISDMESAVGNVLNSKIIEYDMPEGNINTSNCSQTAKENVAILCTKDLKPVSKEKGPEYLMKDGSTEDVTESKQIDCLSNVKIVETTHIPNENDTDDIELVSIEENKQPVTINIEKESNSCGLIIESDEMVLKNKDMLVQPNPLDDSVPSQDSVSLNSSVSCPTQNSFLLGDICILDLDLVDDGMEFTENDEVIENKRIKMESNENDENTNTDLDEYEAKYDLKLLMIPIMYTKKLEHMEILKDKDIYNLNVAFIMEDIITESKPKRRGNVGIKKAINEGEFAEKMTNNVESCEADSNSEQDIDDNVRINSTSYLLQKPRLRVYNSILLCKNPDFNTRLKRLSVGFLKDTRNCQLLKACIPLTIDLHKAFEDKMINGILYLKNNEAKQADGDIIDLEISKNIDSETVSVAPSAMPAQSLIDNVVFNIEDLIPKNDTLIVKQEKIVEDYNINMNNKNDGDKNIEKEYKSPISYNKIVDIDSKSIINNNDVNKNIGIEKECTLPVETSKKLVEVDNKSTTNSNYNIESVDKNQSKMCNLEAFSISENVNKNTIPERRLPNLIRANNYKLGVKNKNVYYKRRVENIPWYKKHTGWKSITDKDVLLTSDALQKILVSLCGAEVSFNKDDPEHNNIKRPTNQQTVSVPKHADNRNCKKPPIKSTIHGREAELEKELKKLRSTHARRHEYCCWANRKAIKMVQVELGIIKRFCLPVHECFTNGKDICTCCCKHKVPECLVPPERQQKNNQKDIINDEPSYNAESVNEIMNDINAVVSNITHDHISISAEQETEASSMNLSTENSNTIDSVIESVISNYCHKEPIESSIEKESQTIPYNGECIVLSDDEACNNDNIEKLQEHTSQIKCHIVYKNKNSPVVIESKRGEISIDATTKLPAPPLFTVTPLPVPSPPKASSISLKNMYQVKDNRHMFLIRSRNTKKRPLHLGRNRILLTTVHLPEDDDISPIKAHDEIGIISENPLKYELPTGVSLVLLPSGQVTAVIDANVEMLTAEEMTKLQNLITLVQDQISRDSSGVVPSNTGENNIQNIPSSDVTTKTNINSEVTTVSNEIIDIDPTNVEVVSVGNCEKSSSELPEFIKINDTHIGSIHNQNNKNADGEEVINTAINITKLAGNLQKEQNVPDLEKNVNNTNVKVCDLNLIDYTEPNKTSADNTMDENRMFSTHYPQNNSNINQNQDNINAPISDTNVIEVAVKQQEGQNSLDSYLKIKTFASINESFSQNTNDQNKKSILSDLMQMSGISADDTKHSENVTCQSNIIPTNVIVDKLHSEKPLIDGDNVLPNNVPELTPVTSIKELKYAAAQNGKFFTLNFVTGQIFMVKLNIRHKSVSDKRNISHNTSISLDNNIITVEDTDDESNQQPPKLIKILEKRKRLTQWRNKLKKSMNHNNEPAETKILLINLKRKGRKRRRKQKIEAQIDLIDSNESMEEEYLEDCEYDNETANAIQIQRKVEKTTNVSSESSDDEPLAKKVMRKKQVENAVLSNENDKISKSSVPEIVYTNVVPIEATNSQGEINTENCEELIDRTNTAEKSSHINFNDITDLNTNNAKIIKSGDMITPVAMFNINDESTNMNEDVSVLISPYGSDGETSQNDCILGV